MINAFEILNNYMSIGSRIRVAVPDGFNPSREYINNVKIKGIGPGALDHKQLLDYKKVIEIFNDLPNFKIYFIEFFDENKSFNSNNYIDIGKKITRSSESKFQNKSFSFSHLSLIFDVIKVKEDKK